eukprot:8009993-Alexandrium_andersonii.AAC.1
MSASLVGSEMCIRDSHSTPPRVRQKSAAHAEPLALAVAVGIAAHAPPAVSYTHLTLPTICSV